MDNEEIIAQVLNVSIKSVRQNRRATLTIEEALVSMDMAVKDNVDLANVSNQRELLIAFFMHFRDKGEQNIGMSIEQFVDDYLSNL